MSNTATSAEERKSLIPAPDKRFVPLGDGLTCRRLRMAESEISVFRALVASYDDGFASCHGDHTGLVYLITVPERLAEVDEWLAELHHEIEFEIVDDESA